MTTETHSKIRNISSRPAWKEIVAYIAFAVIFAACICLAVVMGGH